MSKPEVDVRALAKLARIDVSEAEIQKLEKEIPGILAFVEIIQSVDVSNAEQNTALRNVMREDGEPHQSGIYTEKLLAQAPAREGDRLAVKQVISRAEIFREQSEHKNPSVVSEKATKK